MIKYLDFGKYQGIDLQRLPLNYLAWVLKNVALTEQQFGDCLCALRRQPYKKSEEQILSEYNQEVARTMLKSDINIEI